MGRGILDPNSTGPWFDPAGVGGPDLREVGETADPYDTGRGAPAGLKDVL